MRALEDLDHAAEAIRRRELSSAELIEACLDRYGATEPDLRAFAWLDPARARALARERDAEPPRGLLHGVPVGVKDVFDTAGIPTEHGSALFRGRVPDRSSEVVRALERSGAIVIGKTVTAELAFLTPGPTRNPYDLDRTPGGSSMGSAAAVAAAVVPGAIGTQTNGSTIRPGAFSGAVGFKPTGGRLSTAGALEFSKTLDQVGLFAGDVASVARLTAAASGDALDDWWASSAGGAADRPPRFAAVRTSDWDAADDAMHTRFQADVDALAIEGGPIEWPPLPDGLDEAPALIQTIMAYESARTLGPLAASRPADVSEKARAFFERGRGISTEEYERTIRERLRLIAAFNEWAAPYDAILTLPAAGEAPGLETTGDPRFCSRWTFVGAPAIVLPTGLGPSGLPLGLQLAGARGSDRRVLAAAAWSASLLPTPPRPSLVPR